MAKYILGSGLVGLLARDILGDEWSVIPQGVSRYYSYPVALADDFITTSKRSDYNYLLTPDKRILKRAFSYGGDLIHAPLRWVADRYTIKVYDELIPQFLSLNWFEAPVSRTSCHELYSKMLEKYTDELVTASEKYGKLVSIEPGKIKTENLELEYDEVVSTIPLGALAQAAGIEHNMPYKDAWIYHVQTNELNFEGAEQVFVVDEESPFYKVNKVGPTDYLFFCLKEVPEATRFFGMFTKDNLMVLNRVHIEEYIPIGPPPDIRGFERDYKIRCIGSHAQHDAMADIGTCILRIFRI